MKMCHSTEGIKDPYSGMLHSLTTTIFKVHREYKTGFRGCFSYQLCSNLVHLSLEPYTFENLCDFNRSLLKEWKCNAEVVLNLD